MWGTDFYSQKPDPSTVGCWVHTFTCAVRWFWSMGCKQYEPQMSHNSPCWYGQRSPYLQLIVPSDFVIVVWIYGHRVVSAYGGGGRLDWPSPVSPTASYAFPDTIWAYDIGWLLFREQKPKKKYLWKIHRVSKNASKWWANLEAPWISLAWLVVSSSHEAFWVM